MSRVKKKFNDAEVKETLDDFFEQLEQAKEEGATLRGQIKSEEEYRKSKFGISSIEEGNKRVEELEKENEKLRERRDLLFSQLTEKLG